MVRLAIRCHPQMPVAADELEAWLERQVGELRAYAPRSIVRLMRLTQGRPEAGLDIGWLIELEPEEEEPLLVGNHLADVLRDMRLLELQPTLLAPRDAGGERQSSVTTYGSGITAPNLDSPLPRPQRATKGR